MSAGAQAGIRPGAGRTARPALVLVLAALAALSGCGQTGPLVLQDETPAADGAGEEEEERENG